MKRFVAVTGVAVCCSWLLFSVGKAVEPPAMISGTRFPPGLSDSIYQKSPDREEIGPFSYRYERKMYELADAHPGEPVRTIRAKIQMLWEVRYNDFRTDASNFNVQNGSLLKYAVYVKTYDFLGLALDEWHLGLVQVDSSDQRTLLDYLEDEAARNRGTNISLILNDHCKSVRAAGGRTRRELDAEVESLRAAYQDCRYYSAGLAAVKKDGLWGFVNQKRELVVPCRYRQASSFIHEGIARVTLDGTTWSYIDRKGGAVPGPWDGPGAKADHARN